MTHSVVTTKGQITIPKKIKPFDKVRKLIGIAESGISDLGKNHRKYIIDKIKGNMK